MKKWIMTILFVLAVTSSVHAQEITRDKQTRQMCQDIMRSLYYEIYDVRDKFDGLDGFDEKALFKNKHGLYAIIYKSKPPGTSQDASSRKPYEVGITMTALNDDPFPENINVDHIEFPLLGVKLSSYQSWRSLTHFDVRPLIKKYSDLLAAHQQTYLNLRLYLRSDKKVHLTDEPIEFEVELKNVSNRNLGVKSLGAETLFFLYDNQYWGTKPSSNERGGKNIVLEAGESKTMRFLGEGFKKAKDLEIYGVYRMSVEGVNPFGILRLKVVDE